MISPSTKLFDDLVEISKSDIKFIDLLRPFFQEKYSVDIYDLLFHDLNSMDTNIYFIDISSDNPIVNDPSSPSFYPPSPSTNMDEDVPLSDEEWHFSEIPQDPLDNKLVDSSIRDIEYQNTHYINDRSFHNGYHICKYDLNCQSYNFLCGNSFVNDQGNVKKCGYQCLFYSELPHDCRGEGYSFSSLNSNSHNAYIPSKRYKRSKVTSWAKYSEEYFDDNDYDIEYDDYNF